MKLRIRNMVCPRCILAVKQVFEKRGVAVQNVLLGEVTLDREPSGDTLRAVEQDLIALGFEILDDARSLLIEEIKKLLIQKVQSGEVEEDFGLKKYLTRHLYRDYSVLSKTFSAVEGTTIEQFFLLQKIEKVKELLVYDEMQLSAIAFRLGYSSPQHLSGQFKRFTGMTTGEFRRKGLQLRKPIDTLK